MKISKYIIIGAVILLILGMVGLIIKNIPARPEIKYGEFEYTLEYVMNDETKIIKGVLVCEYDGINFKLGGSTLKWKSYIKGTDKTEYLILSNSDGDLYISLPADAGYYMSDPSYENTSEYYLPSMYFDLKFGEDLDSQGVLDKYNIYITKWKINTPIENSYK